jgi:phosphocarrier protein
MADSMPSTVTKTVTLVNMHGIHVRTAALIADTSESFQAEITITSPHASTDGSDMMQLLLLQAQCGTELVLSATGPDATQAIESLHNLITNGFSSDE